MQQLPKHIIWGESDLTARQKKTALHLKCTGQLVHMEEDNSDCGDMLSDLLKEQQTALTGLLDSTLAKTEMWSIGSTLHASSKCRPCHYVHTALGCQQGASCRFCHLPHMGHVQRASKGRRQHSKKFATALLVAKPGMSPDEYAEIVQACTIKNPSFAEVMRKAEAEEQLKKHSIVTYQEALHAAAS